MATVAETGLNDPQSGKPTAVRISREEFMERLRAFRAEVAPYIPKDWDLDAELEAEHAAILAGAEL